MFANVWRKIVFIVWWIYIPTTIIGTSVLAVAGLDLLAKIYFVIGLSVNIAGLVILKTLGRIKG
jgi:hypothetical protein